MRPLPTAAGHETDTASYITKHASFICECPRDETEEETDKLVYSKGSKV